MASAKRLQPDSQWAHLDKDGDGVYSTNDLCPATKEGFEVDENGCALYQKDTDKDLSLIHI